MLPRSMEARPTSDAFENVIYDSPRTSLAWKVVVSFATGLACAWVMSFLRWFAREGALGAMTAPMMALGAVVSLAMLTAALRSRVVRRVEVTADRRDLLLYRDPGEIERVAFVDVTAIRSERPAGGWSRDPAEDLVLSLHAGAERRYALPDDADTPGIVSDLRPLVGEGASRAS